MIRASGQTGTQCSVDGWRDLGRILRRVTQTLLRNEVPEGGETMARLARAEVFASDEIAVVHVMARTVRRCFLLGDDSVTGKNYDHRKQWIDDQLVHQARHFGIDLLCQAILSNHGV